MTAEATTATATGFRHFHDQLSSLKEQLLAMSAIAEERTDLAVEALLARDREKANLVIVGDALEFREAEDERLDRPNTFA